jgi:hypothetical protein
MVNALEEAPMSSPFLCRFLCRFLLLVATGLPLAGCSARTEVAPSQPPGVVAPVHARAAQRVELPGASAAAVSAERAALTTGTRMQPAAPEVLRFPDGTVGVKVAQQYYHTIVACRLSDGSFTTQCPPGKEPRP